MAKFNRHDFILNGLLDAIGKQNDYWVILNADAYYEKGILTDEDMVTISEAIEKQYEVLETLTDEVIVDEVAEQIAEPIAESSVVAE